MKIYATNTQEDMGLGLSKHVIITSFRRVTIFGKDYTKIVYMHTPTSFSIEKVGDNVDLNENVQVVSGPRAEEIICDMIETEKMRHSTFVWSGAHFENRADLYLLKDQVELYRDPLVRDPIEPEADRRKRRRRKEDRKLQPWEEWDEKKRQEDKERNRLINGSVVYVVKYEGDSLSKAFYQAYRPDGSKDDNYPLPYPVSTGFWIIPSDDPEYKDYVFDVCGRKWPYKVIPREEKDNNDKNIQKET